VKTIIGIGQEKRINQLLGKIINTEMNAAGEGTVNRGGVNIRRDYTREWVALKRVVEIYKKK